MSSSTRAVTGVASGGGWQSELERLAARPDWNDPEMQSTRMRKEQQRAGPHIYGQQQKPRYMSPIPSPYVATEAQVPVPSATNNFNDGTCELCNRTSATTYCSSCDMLLCTRCDTSTHASMQQRHHARGPAAQSSAYRIMCTESHPTHMHGSSSTSASHLDRAFVVRFYCRSCQRVACAACLAPGGAHQAGRHACSRIEDEAAHRIGEIANVIGGERERKQRWNSLTEQVNTCDAYMAHYSVMMELPSLSPRPHTLLCVMWHFSFVPTVILTRCCS